jgi:hypothetical protein
MCKYSYLFKAAAFMGMRTLAGVPGGGIGVLLNFGARPWSCWRIDNAGGGAVGGGTGGPDVGTGVALADPGRMFAARRASRRGLPSIPAGSAAAVRGDWLVGGGGGIALKAAWTTGVLGFCPFAVDANSCSRMPGANAGGATGSCAEGVGAKP